MVPTAFTTKHLEFPPPLSALRSFLYVLLSDLQRRRFLPLFRFFIVTPVFVSFHPHSFLHVASFDFEFITCILCDHPRTLYQSSIPDIEHTKQKQQIQ